MYCNVVVPMNFGDEGCYLVVTEANFIPDKRGGFFEVESWYVVEGYDFSEVYNSDHKKVQAALRDWYMADEEVWNENIRV